MPITFDGASRRVILDSSAVSAEEIWSRWVDWFQSADNSKWLPAMRNVGGDELGGGLRIPPYIFLLNGWRVRPMEASHNLNVTGNLFVEGGGVPVVPTLGTYQVNVSYTVPVQAQAYDVGGSGLSLEERAMLREVWQANFNRRRHDKDANTVTLYDNDGTTPLRVFDADDELTEIVPR